MADGISQQVHQRLGQALQDHPVDFRLGARDHQLDGLPVGMGQIPDRAWQRPGDHRERERPHPDRRVLQFVEHAVAGAEHIGDLLGYLRHRT